MLDEAGERLLSLSSRLGSVPHDAYCGALDGGRALSDHHAVDRRVGAGELRAVSQAAGHVPAPGRSPRGVRGALRHLRRDAQHLRRALQRRDAARVVRGARARPQEHARSGALRQQHPDRGRREPDSRDQGRRRAVPPLSPAAQAACSGSSEYFAFDAFVPLVEHDVRYPLRARCSTGSSIRSRRSARTTSRACATAFDGRWIDVYENQGKRSGAYSAPVYGAHPYMLLNYNDTLDAVFTLAHEMGHSIHTLLSHETQPFVYAGYTIFVAEVPSTLSEALLLDLMLERAKTREERIVLLQHAIDGIVGTFYNQVLFADFELEAHRLVERDQPITSDVLSDIYARLLDEYWGDALSPDTRAQMTWARIPHFFQSPYYVYQYATCFASTAKLMSDVQSARSARARRPASNRYLELLRAGGSDYPMNLLARAGVDLSQPDTVRAVVEAARWAGDAAGGRAAVGLARFAASRDALASLARRTRLAARSQRARAVRLAVSVLSESGSARRAAAPPAAARSARVRDAAKRRAPCDGREAARVLLVSQRLHRIDPHRPPRRNQRGERSRPRAARAARRPASADRAAGPRRADCRAAASAPATSPRRRRRRRAPGCSACATSIFSTCARMRAEREPHADFLRPLAHEQRHHAVDADRRERQREHAEERRPAPGRSGAAPPNPTCTASIVWIE